MSTDPARLPPAGLDGLDPGWSRVVPVECADGERTFHVLDSQPDAGPDTPTLLCFHGNPSWSYLWRTLMRAHPRVRTVAFDHLDMGFSERTGTTRRLADRIADATALTAALGITGRVVTVAHDWGGPVSLGWALEHRDQLDGVVLSNTAVHQPEGAPAPKVIRAVRNGPLFRRTTIGSTGFITGALEMSRPRPSSEIRDGFLAPYKTTERRAAIKTFVEDIPLEDDHPTAPVLDEIADRLAELGDVPALLLWGAKDPVFSDVYLHDLEARLPHADVHRWPNAGHFVTEDAPTSEAISAWLTHRTDWLSPRIEPAPVNHHAGPTTVLDAMSEPSRADAVAVREMVDAGKSITFGELSEKVEATAAGLREAGVAPGDRVAIMIPPGIDLVAAVYGAWRAQAVAVLVDGALTPPQMTAALRSANPSWLVGITRALAASRALRWPGTAIAAEPLTGARKRALGSAPSLPALSAIASPLPPSAADASDLAAVVFTSGSTGPSKGVLYTHGQLAAQRDAIATQYDITPDDRLVAAFAPFALYGPMLGITSVVPDMDVSAPSSLDARSLAQAIEAIDATMVFASPAALENIVRTATGLSAGQRESASKVRVLLSAGAPVRASLLRDMGDVLPNAVAHTPYGMTECLPVASISLPEIEAAGTADGVCVGYPLPGVDVEIVPMRNWSKPGDLGEIVVRAPHMRLAYDRLWYTTALAGIPVDWHRTGDVGFKDSEGRLWVAGRMQHVIWTGRDSETGWRGEPVGPVGLEKAVEQIEGVYMAAVVGVGPESTNPFTGESAAMNQCVVVVVQRDDPPNKPGLASLELIDAVRAVADIDVVAVLDAPKLPVDRRHNSKIDRTAVAAWAATALAGGKLGDL